jgi:hypothetical protein
MSKRNVDQLIKQAQVFANDTDGILLLLFTLKNNRIRKVTFDKGHFKINERVLSFRDLQIQLRKFDDKLAKKILKYAEFLSLGIWTLEKWHREMEKLIENSHILYGALAIGSILFAIKDGTVIRRIERDKSYLEKFKKDIFRGKYTQDNKEISSIKIRNRGRSYIRSASITYANLVHKLHITLGYKEAKRILTAKESCKRIQALNGCIDIGGIWMPIKEMPPIGTLVCGQYCLCYLIFR